MQEGCTKVKFRARCLSVANRARGVDKVKFGARLLHANVANHARGVHETYF